jgi:hypothetical protein
MLKIEAVLEDLNFDGNMYQTYRSIKLLRNQDDQGWEIDRRGVFSVKQTTTHSNKRAKTECNTLNFRLFPEKSAT